MTIASGFQTRSEGGFHWTIRTDAPPELISRLLGAGRAKVCLVKTNPKRSVFRIEAGTTRYYAKRHLFRSLPDALSAALRGTRAEREWRNLLLLSQLGLPVVTPVAVGVRRRLGLPVESWLVTEEAQGATFREVAQAALQAAGGPQWDSMGRASAEVASLLRQLHDRGFDLPDLHAENIIISEAGHAVLCDLHAARRRWRPLSISRRTENIAFLCNSVPDGLTGGRSALRFLRHYLGRSAPRSRLADLVSHIRIASVRLRMRHVRSRSRRCFREGSEFTSTRTPIGRVYRRRDLGVEEVIRAIENHNAILQARGGGAVLKRGTRSNVTLLDQGPAPSGDAICVKEFVCRSLLRHLLPARMRHRRVLRFWAASLGLRVRGLPAPEALAAVLGRGGSGYILMRPIEGAEALPAYVARALAPTAPRGRRRAFIRAAADALAQFYAAGAFHRDLKGTNVLVRERGHGWEFAVLDIEDVRFPRRVTSGMMMRNLAQLNASVDLSLTWADRMRFLRHLAQRAPVLSCRAAIRRIAELTLQRGRSWAS